MARKLQIKRGRQAKLPKLSEGEFGLTTDQKKLYIGHSAGNIRVATETDISEVSSSLTGEQLLLNGGFDIWQKGESFNNVGGLIYTADMWHTVWNNCNISKSKVSNINTLKCMGAVTTMHYPSIGQNFEDDFRNQLIGETMTLSAKIRSIGTPEYVNLYGMKNLIAVLPLDGEWHEIKATGIAEDMHTTEFCDVRITAKCKDIVSGFEVEWVKFELGDMATKFVPQDYGAELAKCQRYYVGEQERYDFYISSPCVWYPINLPFPVKMRGKPTIQIGCRDNNNNFIQNKMQNDLTGEIVENITFYTPLINRRFVPIIWSADSQLLPVGFYNVVIKYASTEL